MADWIERVLQQAPGFEREVVERYTRRLLDLAGRKLPGPLRRRVDPEDVVQSVYRSFFQRLQDGRFSFDDSQDLWRLLAAMTFRKACNARKFHLRDRRDARREQSLTPPKGADSAAVGAVLADPQDEDLNLLLGCLEELLRGLPESCRDIVTLRLQGHSIEEVAAKVKRSRRTVLRVLAGVAAAAGEDSP
jgi:RNA polymerase sigma-70 factor (ECF subfamily)